MLEYRKVNKEDKLNYLNDLCENSNAKEVFETIKEDDSYGNIVFHIDNEDYYFCVIEIYSIHEKDINKVFEFIKEFSSIT